MEIIKINREKIEDLDLPANVTEVYFLKNELEILGYGFINYNTKNEVELFIKEDYRGDEHGKELFSKLFSEFQGEAIHLQVSLDNYPMIKIIEGYNPLNLGTNKRITSYVIKKG